ncbi:hypothetical protein MSAN_02182600 [Mycena sanguinolenta]|uniref:Trypsin-like peptidase domain-containing protein n=1 Tax=Mycena sanguinolenta TaxID=230812 RepID=A0A8H6XFR4_9AGAR|nr:hypothetical protein MSAN_02182600 [Mycena sanguinolenta]
MLRSCLQPRLGILTGRTYATVSASLPTRIWEQLPSDLDKVLLSSLSTRKGPALRDLIQNYTEQSGHVLAPSLPYESRPPRQRRVTFDNGDSVVMIAHCALDKNGKHAVTVSSGFALAVPGKPDDGPFILTCAHTLEEIRRSPLLADGGQVITGSFVVSGTGDSCSVHPVSSIVSAVPRSDILILQTESPVYPTLPVSPYPVHRDTAIRAHFVTHQRPEEPGWTPWLGGSWSKWVRGIVLGYRDFTGRETQPGTYDSLSHMLFSPLPTPGSSGGPIVDEESGAVVGVVLGTRMDNRVEGVRGWGVPSETIFEMFSLPIAR